MQGWNPWLGAQPPLPLLFQCPKPLGDSYNYQLQDDLFIRDQIFRAEWEFGFNLFGNRSGKQTGESFIGWGNYKGEGMWKTYANEPILKIDLSLNFPDDLHELVSETLEGFIRQI